MRPRDLRKIKSREWAELLLGSNVVCSRRFLSSIKSAQVYLAGIYSNASYPFRIHFINSAKLTGTFGSSIGLILSVAAQTKIRATVVQTVVIYMVNKNAGWGTKNFPVHVDSEDSALAAFFFSWFANSAGGVPNTPAALIGVPTKLHEMIIVRCINDRSHSSAQYDFARFAQFGRA